MMRRDRRGLVLGVPVLAAATVFLDVPPAAAKDTGVCTLLTRAEVGKLLGANVVRPSRRRARRRR
jgi:hypothetical protein